MTDPTTDAPSPTPAKVPGERRLAHPPSDRYRGAVSPTAAASPPATADPAASASRGRIFGFMAADVGAVAIIIFGGVLALSGGLLVIAGVIGWAVAATLRAGAGSHMSRGARVSWAVGLAVLSITLGQLGLWVYALTEGGVLGPLDYLAQAFGWLVPLELIIAALVAWLTAR